jgi:hypothetical protein
VLTCAKLLRRQCSVPVGYDEVVIGNIPYDDFTIYANRMVYWISLHRENEMVFALNDLLIAVNELKTRVNSGLMKLALFDDLIADAYSLLYEKALPALRAQMDGEGNRERMSINHLTTLDSGTEPPATLPPGILPHDPVAFPRPRPTRAVVKRDIVRKADALLVKPTIPSGPALLPRPNAEMPTQPPLPIREDLLRDNIDSAAASSVPGSVHDSADDESELSEVEESRMSKPPLFPGLLGGRDESAMETEEEEANVDEEGDDNEPGEDEVEEKDDGQEPKVEGTPGRIADYHV